MTNGVDWCHLRRSSPGARFCCFLLELSIADLTEMGLQSVSGGSLVVRLMKSKAIRCSNIFRINRWWRTPPIRVWSFAMMVRASGRPGKNGSMETTLFLDMTEHIPLIRRKSQDPR